MKRHCRGLWQSFLVVGQAEADAVACMVERKAAVVVVDMAVVVGATEVVDVVRTVELKAAAGAGMGASKTVPMSSRVESKTAAAAAAVASRVDSKAAAAGNETSKAAAVAGVLQNILRPHAGRDTAHEWSATECVAQRIVAGVFGLVAIRGV